MTCKDRFILSFHVYTQERSMLDVRLFCIALDVPLHRTKGGRDEPVIRSGPMKNGAERSKANNAPTPLRAACLRPLTRSVRSVFAPRFAYLKDGRALIAPKVSRAEGEKSEERLLFPPCEMTH